MPFLTGWVASTYIASRVFFSTARADLTSLARLTNLAGGLLGDPLVNLLVSPLGLHYLSCQWASVRKKYSAECGMTRAVQKHSFRNLPLIFWQSKFPYFFLARPQALARPSLLVLRLRVARRNVPIGASFVFHSSLLSPAPIAIARFASDSAFAKNSYTDWYQVATLHSLFLSD